MSLYLDASVVLPTLVPEAGSAKVDALLAGSTSIPWISEFAAAEVASTLSRLVRMHRLQARLADQRLREFDAWRAADAEMIDVESSDVRLAGVIVRRFDLMLRAPDALHLAICRRLEAQLVTMDRRLAAAGRDLGVAVTLL